jgi:hypothetical protein
MSRRRGAAAARSFAWRTRLPSASACLAGALALGFRMPGERACPRLPYAWLARLSSASASQVGALGQGYGKLRPRAMRAFSLSGAAVPFAVAGSCGMSSAPSWTAACCGAERPAEKRRARGGAARGKAQGRRRRGPRKSAGPGAERPSEKRRARGGAAREKRKAGGGAPWPCGVIIVSRPEPVGVPSGEEARQLCAHGPLDRLAPIGSPVPLLHGPCRIPCSMACAGSLALWPMVHAGPLGP